MNGGNLSNTTVYTEVCCQSRDEFTFPHSSHRGLLNETGPINTSSNSIVKITMPTIIYII